MQALRRKQVVAGDCGEGNRLLPLEVASLLKLAATNVLFPFHRDIPENLDQCLGRITWYCYAH